MGAKLNNIRIPWHPAFYGGMELELREYKSILDFEREYNLSKEPLKMDLLIIKKKSDVEIQNPIAKIFKKHNIIEYKSPGDKLNIDNLYKTIGYASLYKGLSKKKNEIPADEITVSLFRDKRPTGLFSDLRKMDATVENINRGVYYIYGLINFPLQIVVMNELEGEKHSALRILKSEADETDVKRFLMEISALTEQGDKNNISAVLAASIVANKDIYKEVRTHMLVDEATMKDYRIIAGIDEQYEKLQAQVVESQAQIAESQAEIEELKRRLSKYETV